MSGRPTLVNWCPGGPCDFCDCHWVPTGITLPLITDPGHPDDGAIDQDAAFCGSPVWGMGLISESPLAEPGSLVSGSVTLSLVGVWSVSGQSVDEFGGTVPDLTAPPAFPFDIPISYESVGVFLIELATAAILDFHESDNGTGIVSGGTLGSGPFFTSKNWTATCKILFPNCVMLDATKDQIVSPFNCVLPYTGPIPDIAFSIAPSRPTVDATAGYPPGVLFVTDSDGNPIYNFALVDFAFSDAFQAYLHVKKAIDPV